MERRVVVAAAVVVVVSLAGCSVLLGDGGAGPSTATPTSEPTATATPTPGPAAFDYPDGYGPTGPKAGSATGCRSTRPTRRPWRSARTAS
ncbi:hypothetical protein BRD05_07840 [Halobacteriales archaeon QS_9_70_65]|nr:MAG: hypothetical protein BRD05_07840 [Halobacteriales archaeon QS_9_70_65]